MILKTSDRNRQNSMRGGLNRSRSIPSKVRLLTVLAGISLLGGAATAAKPSLDSDDKLLSALVQLATKEDLTDIPRINAILGIQIELEMEEPYKVGEGRFAQGGSFHLPKDIKADYPEGWRLRYRRVEGADRLGSISIGFNRFQRCLNIDKVLAEFGKYGVLTVLNPLSIYAPLPRTKNGEKFVAEQPNYAYVFTSDHRISHLTFAYTKCLISFLASN